MGTSFEIERMPWKSKNIAKLHLENVSHSWKLSRIYPFLIRAYKCKKYNIQIETQQPKDNFK